MVNYGLKDKVVLITGANNPQGIGATTALTLLEKVLTDHLRQMQEDRLIEKHECYG